jgi:hypothetical protein
MEIPGANLPAPDFLPHAPLAAPPVHGLAKAGAPALVQQIHAADAAMLLDVAPADLVKLAQILQPQAPPEQAAQIQGLIKETALAVSGGNVDKAVAFLAEAVKLNPLQLEELRTLPPLRLEHPAAVDHDPNAVQAPDPKLELLAAGMQKLPPELGAIHADIERLASHLTTVAKLDAEVKLSQAETAIEANGGVKLMHWQTRPQTLLQIGHRLYEAGGYPNYVRAADVATTIQSAYWEDAIVYQQETATRKLRRAADESDRLRDPTLAALWQTWVATRGAVPKQTRILWGRAPLLVLLLGWLAAGLVGGICSLLLRDLWPVLSNSFWIDSWAATLSDFGFKIWGLGFLALVGFGFYATIRRRR